MRTYEADMIELQRSLNAVGKDRIDNSSGYSYKTYNDLGACCHHVNSARNDDLPSCRRPRALTANATKQSPSVSSDTQ